MSCLPKETWLALDDEYMVSTGDYVFCCQREITIQRYILEQGLSKVCGDCRTTKPMTYLDYAERGPRWIWGGKLVDSPHLGAGVLISADFKGEVTIDTQHIHSVQVNAMPPKAPYTVVKEAENRFDRTIANIGDHENREEAD